MEDKAARAPEGSRGWNDIAEEGMAKLGSQTVLESLRQWL